MGKTPLSPEQEEAAREEERRILSEKFDVILVKLDAIDRLENVQVRHANLSPLIGSRMFR